MKFSVLAAVIFASHLVSASPLEVKPLPPPTTKVQNQSRTVLKHRKPPLLYTVTIATVPQFIALNHELPVGVTKPSVRASNALISPVETKVYTVDGDLWRVAMEDNDDEYHLEICARGAGRKANRIIVEIPPDPAYAKTRLQLLSLLPDKPPPKPGPYVFRPGMTKELSKPIAVRVTGYPFFDGHHWTSKSVRGNKHGTAYTATLWEVHPAWKIGLAPKQP
jgi:hypothetical protein